jgi:lipopolysaccharide export system protein LptA
MIAMRSCPTPSAARRARMLGVVLAGFLVSAPPAFAEHADKEKPAVISADHQDGNQLDQVHVYTGDVVLTKGTIIVRGDQLTIKEDPEGYNFGTALATKPNKLAYFKQKREGVDEYIEGQAERIEYDEKSDTIRLFNHAIVKRLVAGRDADEVRGDRIDYNSRTELYSAESLPGKRTNSILQPKIKPGSAPSASVRPAPSVPLELKKEPTIDAKPAT